MISGEKIFLRALEPADLEILYQWENDPALWHVSETLEPISKYVLKQYLSNAHLDIHTVKQLRLMIVIKNDLKAVGTIELFDYNPLHARAGIGIMIQMEDRRKKIASESIRLLEDYCSGVLSLKQLYCNITEDNEGSLALFKQLGYQVIGVKKCWTKRKSEWINEVFLQKILDNQ